MSKFLELIAFGLIQLLPNKRIPLNAIVEPTNEKASCSVCWISAIKLGDTVRHGLYQSENGSLPEQHVAGIVMAGLLQSGAS